MSIGFKRDFRPGLYCVELRTSQWERAVQWYREALGLRALVRVVEDGYALFEAGETRLALLARKTPGESSARWSLGFEVENLDVVARRLIDAGSHVTRPKASDEGFQEIITADPDGNTIRLFAWPTE
jgi:predicted enzyme related to lactoylglutathione lyase